MGDWGKGNPAKRRDPILAQAVAYWLFRYAKESSYFIEIAREIWKDRTELRNRFCFAKEAGNATDSFELLLQRFRSEEARNYKSFLDSNRLSATYPAVFDFGISYQAGRPEFQAAKVVLLSKRLNSNAQSTAVYGAGGYGKTSLAHELCDDNDVRARFPGGIYWLQFSLADSSAPNRTGWLSVAIDHMLQAQYGDQERPPFHWKNDESDLLALLAVLPNRPLLIVADDVGSDRQCRWLTKVPLHVSVLITTRRQGIAKEVARKVPIERLTEEPAYNLLTHGMANLSDAQTSRLRELASAFRGWPLLLSLANGRFKQLNSKEQARIEHAINEYESFFADEQIDAWDVPETDAGDLERRQKLVGHCIEAGMNAIHPDNHPGLLRTLAVFPDDIDIPFSVVIRLWNQISSERIGQTKGFTRLRHFNDFSFFSAFDEEGQVLRLHDEVVAYFRSGLTAEGSQSLHRHLITSLKEYCGEDWATFPSDHAYGWTHLLHHLEKAGLSDEANDLRTDFRWLKAKLAAVGSSELQRSFLPPPKRKDARDVGRAVNLSIHVLSRRPMALAHQLYGRLGRENENRLQSLSEAARTDSDCWPIPNRPHLAPLGRELLRLVGHAGPIERAGFDRSGCRIVTASRDGTARLWDAETGEFIGELLEGNRGFVNSAAFDPSGRIVATTSRNAAQLWDAETGMPIGNPLEGHQAEVTDAAFDPSGRKIVTASGDCTARLWDVATREEIRRYDGHGGPVTSAVFDPSGRKIATVSNDGTARLWSAETGEQIGKPLKRHRDVITSAAFDPSGSILATASWDKTVQLWDVEKGAAIGTPLKGHWQWVNSVAFDPTGRKLVTASNDCTVRLWDAATREPIGDPFEGHERKVTSATFDPTGRRILTTSYDQTARLWHVDAISPVGITPDKHYRSVTCGAFDPSGRKIVTASTDVLVQVWDTKNVEPISELSIAHDRRISAIDFDPSGRKIVTASDDCTARLWDSETGLSIGNPFRGHRNSIASAAFDPSGRKIVTASYDCTAQLWDTETSKPIRDPLVHRAMVNSAMFDPSGRKVVTASRDQTARLWDAETGEPIGKPLEGHRREVTSAAFDPSGRTVVTASRDQTARLWDAATGEPIGKPLEGHQNWVTSAAFDNSGSTIITTSYDGTIRLWDVKTKACSQIIDFDSAIERAVWQGDYILIFPSSGSFHLFCCDRNTL